MKSRRRRFGHILLALGVLVALGGVIYAIACEQAATSLVYVETGPYPGFYDKPDDLHATHKALVIVGVTIGVTVGIFLGLLGLILTADWKRKKRFLRYLHVWSYPCFALAILGPFLELVAATGWFGNLNLDDNNWINVGETMAFTALLLTAMGIASLKHRDLSNIWRNHLAKRKKPMVAASHIPPLSQDPHNVQKESMTMNLPVSPALEPNAQPCFRRPKSRLAYVLLAFPFFGLGLFGMHNFYALRIKSGVAQFLMMFLSLGLLSPICLIWSVFEICLVNKDGRGIPLQ